MRVIGRFLAFLGMLLAVPAVAQTSYSSLYVFGDSLVDSGNANLFTGGLEAPETDGFAGGRFSNGANFADYLSDALFEVPATPALIPGGTNIAVGGATAELITGTLSPSFLEQIFLYNMIIGDPIPNDALVLVTFGGNDVRRTLETGGLIDFTDATTDFLSGLGGLYTLGARNFLITGSPDIGLLPRSLEDVDELFDTPEDIDTRLGELTFRSQQISALFGGASNTFAGLTGANVTYFDLFSFEAMVRANPAAYGLPATLDLDTPCQILGGGVPQLANCANSLYFDEIHPTTIVHQVIADALLAELDLDVAPIPEPQTWLMLLLGFAFLGAQMRARRRAAAVPA